MTFYSEVEYEAWRTNRSTHNQSTGIATYFKGLGTSSSALAKEYFRNIHKNTVSLRYSGTPCGEALDLFFNKTRSDDRKTFLMQLIAKDSFVDYSQDTITMEHFVHNELLPAYAWAAIERGIPALDGFNNARRKILWGARSLGLTKDTSVAKAAGKIASKANYHHRGTAMENAIIGMAADYVGAGGNVNLLLPMGQFGSRHNHEAASAAYPMTALNNPLQALIYPPADDPVLDYVLDEGIYVEPTCYLPVIAMTLCFGAEGIAVGWSTKCPRYNPLHLIEAAEAWIDGVECERKLVPFFRGFKGPIVEQDDGSYLVCGVCYYTSTGDLHVTEIPPFKETDAYKEDWVKGEFAEKVDPGDNHTDERVHLVLKKCKAMENPLRELGLERRITFTNVYLLDSENRVKKYESPEEVVRDHAVLRLTLYEKRIAYQIQKCEKEARVAETKAEYIRKTIDGSFVMKDHDDNDCASRALTAIGFSDISIHPTLLEMPGNSQTREKAARLCAEAEKKRMELQELHALTPRQAWKNDLAKLKNELRKDSRYTE